MACSQSVTQSVLTMVALFCRSVQSSEECCVQMSIYLNLKTERHSLTVLAFHSSSTNNRFHSSKVPTKGTKNKELLQIALNSYRTAVESPRDRVFSLQAFLSALVWVLWVLSVSSQFIETIESIYLFNNWNLILRNERTKNRIIEMTLKLLFSQLFSNELYFWRTMQSSVSVVPHVVVRDRHWTGRDGRSTARHPCHEPHPASLSDNPLESRHSVSLNEHNKQTFCVSCFVC